MAAKEPCLVDVHPSERIRLERQLKEIRDLMKQNFNLEAQFPQGTMMREFLFQARVKMGDFEDRILRDLGIRGR